MEQQLRSALAAEAEQVDVDVDALWRQDQPAVGTQPVTDPGG